MMNPREGKLSVVIVLDNSTSFEDVIALDRTLTPLVKDIDYVLIANGLERKASQLYIERIHELTDTTVHFLPETVHPDFARLIGMDNAVGDWILCMDNLMQSPASLTALLAAIQDGIEYVRLRTSSDIHTDSWLYRLVSNIYVRIYHNLTGLAIDRSRSGVRLYSREAAQYILHNRSGELLLRSASLGNFFPGIVLEDRDPPPQKTARSTVQGSIRGWDLLMRSTTFPLRLVTFGAVASCILNVLYAVAALLIHAFKSDIASGWTTLSLQGSIMFFVISLMLALISEYLVQIDRGINHRLRYIIIREIRSRRSRLEGRRNVWRHDSQTSFPNVDNVSRA